MITVSLTANGVRRSIMADPDTKLNDFFNANNVRLTQQVFIDGGPLSPTEYDKTFAELGIEDACTISSIVKTNNA